jgi:hypothetical protein
MTGWTIETIKAAFIRFLEQLQPVRKILTHSTHHLAASFAFRAVELASARFWLRGILATPVRVRSRRES